MSQTRKIVFWGRREEGEKAEINKSKKWEGFSQPLSRRKNKSDNFQAYHIVNNKRKRQKRCQLQKNLSEAIF